MMLTKMEASAGDASKAFCSSIRTMPIDLKKPITIILTRKQQMTMHQACPSSSFSADSSNIRCSSSLLVEVEVCELGMGNNE